MANKSTWAIIPIRIKPLTKSRLASELDVQDRKLFTQAMFYDVLQAIAHSQTIDQSLIVTSDKTLQHELTWQGYEVFKTNVNQLNKELKLAVEHAEQKDAKNIIIVLADLPLLTGLILDQIVNLSTRLARPIIAQDWKGVGTNILFFRLPNPFYFQFGTKSFQAHLSSAREAGVSPIIFYSLETALDIDDPKAFRKLQEITSQERQMKKSKTREVLHEFQKRKKEAA